MYSDTGTSHFDKIQRLLRSCFAMFRCGRLFYIVLIGAMIVVVMRLAFSFDVYPVTERVSVATFKRVDQAYVAPLALKAPVPFLLYVSTDRETHPKGSRLQVLVDGTPLGHPHSLHHDIFHKGDGRYSFWGDGTYSFGSGTLYFSFPKELRNIPEKIAIRYFYSVNPVVFFMSICLIALYAIALLWEVRSTNPRRYAQLRFGVRLAAGVVGASVLAAAVILRLGIVEELRLPLLVPDSGSYIVPALSPDIIPLSEIRTAGFALFIRLARLLSDQPIGYLYASILVWLVTYLTLIYCLIRAKMNMFLLILFMLLSAAVLKDISFEHLVLSENLLRCMFLLFSAIVVFYASRPCGPFFILATSLVIVYAILVKPSAVIMVPALWVFAVATGLKSATLRLKPRLYASAAVTALVVLALLAYAALYKQKFGRFDLTSFTGFNLYSHVGHLTYVDGGRLPELKERLRPTMEAYQQWLAAGKARQANWLVFGATNSEIREFMAVPPPTEVIRQYLSSKGIPNSMHEIDRIFKTLAIEVITQKPSDYIELVIKSFRDLFYDGFGFVYYGPINKEHLKLYKKSVDLYGADLGKIYPEAAINFQIPDLSSVIYKYNDYLINWNEWSQEIFSYIITVSLICFSLGLCAIVFMKLDLIWLRISLTLGIMVLGYSLFLAMLNISEIQRFSQPIHDVILLTSIAALSIIAELLGKTKQHARDPLVGEPSPMPPRSIGSAQ